MSNFNTSGLLQALDRIKPELKPLPQHFITSQDQHTRELYATLLAAVLLSDGQVSEPQSRLFGMLLQSMQLDNKTARFFELAQQLDAGQLKSAIRGIQPIKESFALDALILARLSARLGQEQLQLMAELLDALSLDQKIDRVIEAVSFTLELNQKSSAIKVDVGLMNKSPILNEIWEDPTKGGFYQGVWIDPTTGLMWSRVSVGQKWEDGQAKGKIKRVTLYEAEEFCKSSRLAGFDDWRLPTIDELKSLVAVGQTEYRAPVGFLLPAVDSPEVSSEQASYWSSTASHHSYSGLYMSFITGKPVSYNRSYHRYARAVRDVSKEQELTNSLKDITAISGMLSRMMR